MSGDPALDQMQIARRGQASGGLFQNTRSYEAIQSYSIVSGSSRSQGFRGVNDFSLSVEPFFFHSFHAPRPSMHQQHGENAWINRTETWTEIFGPKNAGKNSGAAA